MLNLAGVVSTAKLRSWRRAEIFLVFVFAAIVTPSQDPFTMIALGLPMILLYEVALVIGWFNDKRKARRGDTSPYANLDDDEASPLDFDDLPHPATGEPATSAASADPVGTAVGAAGAPGSLSNAAHLDIT
ncbi:Sec-independent protein translocase subunit TatC [Candidatus Protofrankia californiensis]|uniref:Sec-independent protein translocase subunit TatC n=2 Tax=Protofrankia TaxID=2994361 RepID=A0A1C3NZV5_9ACTN|nr:Sec-independent protein translocase subunit TatC [Candidatus Protofrankia californiensis]